jgi:hypothetical protein
MQLPIIDINNEAQVVEYFARLEKDYPQLIEAMRVMNISYQQYLEALSGISRRISLTTSSARLTL